MHFLILPDHQKLFFKKDIFESLEWLKTCFAAFARTSRPPETFLQKRYFWTSGVVKNVFFCIFTYVLWDHQKLFKRLNGFKRLKRVLMHLCILPDHQNHVLKKDFSYLAGLSPYISLKIKKRHYEHHMIEAHK